MTNLTLYGLDASPPVRAVLLALNALELDFEYKIVNLLQAEHLSEAYVKMNPEHTVPLLEDDGQFIWDSHAIMAYLVDKYADNDDLYPKDLLQRSVVDQRLHFDSGPLFSACVRGITRPLLFLNETTVAQSKIDSIAEIYAFVEKFLSEHVYIAGDQLTIADFSLVSSLSSLQVYLKLDETKYPNVAAWMKLMRQLPYYEKANGTGVAQFHALVKSKNFTIVQ